MNQFRFAMPFLVAATLAGCATDGPTTNGDSVRAVIASQVIAPQARKETGTDGAAAIAVYKNYVQSYASPRPQVEDSAFRK